MNLTNVFLEMISLTNLAIFVNRLIVDGNYETALFLYDDASIRDTHFIQELNDLSNDNYTIMTFRSEDCVNWTSYDTDELFWRVPRSLQIFMINYDHDWNDRLLDLETPFTRPGRNYVFLLPMQHQQQKEDILLSFDFYSTFRNSCIAFYETPRTAQNVVSDKSIDVFVNMDCYTVNCSIFDADNRADISAQLNQIGNLNEFVFSKFIFETFLHLNQWDSTLTAMDHKNIMLDDSDLLMANYIARNMKNLTTQLHTTGGCDYKAKNGSIYAEFFSSSLDCSAVYNKY